MAAAMNSGALLNAMPRMESDTFVRSRAAIYPATLVSLSSAMNSLNSAGRIFLTACGSTMSRIVALSESPRLRPASACPGSMEAMPPRMISAT